MKEQSFEGYLRKLPKKNKESYDIRTICKETMVYEDIFGREFLEQIEKKKCEYSIYVFFSEGYFYIAAVQSGAFEPKTSLLEEYPRFQTPDKKAKQWEMEVRNYAFSEETKKLLTGLALRLTQGQKGKNGKRCIEISDFYDSLHGQTHRWKQWRLLEHTQKGDLFQLFLEQKPICKCCIQVKDAEIVYDACMQMQTFLKDTISGLIRAEYQVGDDVLLVPYKEDPQIQEMADCYSKAMIRKGLLECKTINQVLSVLGKEKLTMEDMKELLYHKAVNYQTLSPFFSQPVSSKKKTLAQEAEQLLQRCFQVVGFEKTAVLLFPIKHPECVTRGMVYKLDADAQKHPEQLLRISAKYEVLEQLMISSKKRTPKLVKLENGDTIALGEIVLTDKKQSTLSPKKRKIQGFENVMEREVVIWSNYLGQA